MEGKNIFIEWRFAEGKSDRLPSLAAELVRLKVDVIVAEAPTSTRSAKQATVTIPIVMVFDDDPVGSGFIASLARPGGNITGLSTLSPEISGKQLELLKEIVPRLSYVAVLGTSTEPGTAQALKEVEIAARAVGAQLQPLLDVRESKDIETEFRAATRGHADAVLVLSSPVFFSQRTKLVSLAAKSRLPVIYKQARICGRRRAYNLRREHLTIYSGVLLRTLIKFLKAPSPRSSPSSNRQSSNLLST